MIRTNAILTIFELLIVENIKVFFWQFMVEAPKSFIVLDVNGIFKHTQLNQYFKNYFQHNTVEIF